jgi:hypothetical protein
MRNTRCDGLYFMALASFNTFGNVNKGNLFVVAKWCAGTCKLSAFRRASSGLRSLFSTHISLKEIGSLPWVNPCMNFNWEYVISSSKGRIPRCLKRGPVWSRYPTLHTIRTASNLLKRNANKIFSNFFKGFV